MVDRRYIIIIITLSVVVLLVTRPRPSQEPTPEPTPEPIPEPTPEPTGKVLFLDNYEKEQKIVKTTSENWKEFSNDAKKGNYWSDTTYWLEIGKVEQSGKYTLDPSLGDFRVTDRVAYNGNNSVELTIYETPPGYVEHGAGLARYIRNTSMAKDGVYEIGAWFYVPAGNTPRYIHVSIENHLTWTKGYLVHVGVDPETNKIITWVQSEGDKRLVWETIGEVDFQYDTWFKLWIIYDTRKPTTFEIGYKSPTEEKTFWSDRLIVQGMMISFIGLPSFNFYAGALNTQESPTQKVYVDDFYVNYMGT